MVTRVYYYKIGGLMFNKIFKKNSIKEDDLFFEKVMDRYKKNEKVDQYIVDMFKNETKDSLNKRFNTAIKNVEKENEYNCLFKKVNNKA